jgi:SAM-dependent methyltransferase
VVVDRLLGDEVLWASDVVANCAMNRLRQLSGPNSYARELGFDPLDLLLDRAAPVAWLDLCCGSGRALVQAGRRLAESTPPGATPPGVTLVGVDLVDAFEEGPAELVCAPADRFEPRRSFDLITCVHGLHYVGDKLGLLARAAGWLTGTGRLVADFDPASVRVEGQTPRQVTRQLRAAGFDYEPRHRRISRTGRATVVFPYTYLGADDRAGPNYTGQPAVTSHYRPTVPGPRPTPPGRAPRR